MKKRFEIAVSLFVGKQQFDYYHHIVIDPDDNPERFERAVKNLIRVRFPVGSLSVSSSPVDNVTNFPCSFRPYECADYIAWGLVGVILGFVAVTDLIPAGVHASVHNVISCDGK